MKEPYIFQSGKRKGVSLEVLMFRDYSFLIWFFKKLNQNKSQTKNRLHTHLEWLIKKGESRATKVICPICYKKNISMFFVAHHRDGIIPGIQLFSCNNDSCIQKIKHNNLSNYPLKFSTFLRFKGRDRKIIEKMFKKVFLGGDKVSKEKAFSLFKE